MTSTILVTWVDFDDEGSKLFKADRNLQSHQQVYNSWQGSYWKNWILTQQRLTGRLP